MLHLIKLLEDAWIEDWISSIKLLKMCGEDLGGFLIGLAEAVRVGGAELVLDLHIRGGLGDGESSFESFACSPAFSAASLDIHLTDLFMDPGALCSADSMLETALCVAEGTLATLAAGVGKVSLLRCIPCAHERVELVCVIPGG